MAGLLRLEVLMARLGLCGRKEANALIVAGRVRVDGVPIHADALELAGTDVP
jgi:16S rRNA U516 pseudouridylate synthase RsuA-like enzyme